MRQRQPLSSRGCSLFELIVAASLATLVSSLVLQTWIEFSRGIRRSADDVAATAVSSDLLALWRHDARAASSVGISAYDERNGGICRFDGGRITWTITANEVVRSAPPAMDRTFAFPAAGDCRFETTDGNGVTIATLILNATSATPIRSSVALRNGEGRP